MVTVTVMVMVMVMVMVSLRYHVLSCLVLCVGGWVFFYPNPNPNPKSYPKPNPLSLTLTFQPSNPPTSYRVTMDALVLAGYSLSTKADSKRVMKKNE